MTDIQVATVIEAPPAAVWEGIRDLSTHTEWMADAVEIRFLTESRAGIGTAFECDTRLGPLTTTDVIRVTAWMPGEAMGIVHEGSVSGEGTFVLEDLGDGRTRFRWEEDLRFPLRFGGWVGAWLARPVITRIWQANLHRLKARIEGSAPPRTS